VLSTFAVQVLYAAVADDMHELYVAWHAAHEVARSGCSMNGATARANKKIPARNGAIK
jgi:hypothetical protein